MQTLNEARETAQRQLDAENKKKKSSKVCKLEFLALSAAVSAAAPACDSTSRCPPASQLDD